jgi:hypothetical protein
MKSKITKLERNWFAFKVKYIIICKKFNFEKNWSNNAKHFYLGMHLWDTIVCSINYHLKKAIISKFLKFLTF